MENRREYLLSLTSFYFHWLIFNLYLKEFWFASLKKYHTFWIRGKHFWNPKLICCTKYGEIRLTLSQTLDKNIIGPNQRLILNSRKYLNWIVLQQQLTQGIIHLVRTQNFPKNIISYPLIRTRTCVHQWVRNVSFSGESWIRLANLPLGKIYPPWKEGNLNLRF